MMHHHTDLLYQASHWVCSCILYALEAGKDALEFIRGGPSMHLKQSKFHVSYQLRTMPEDEPKKLSAELVTLRHVKITECGIKW